MKPLSLYPLAPLVSVAVFAGSLAAHGGVTVAPIYPGLKIERPVQVVIPPDGSGRRFLVEQKGLVSILSGDESAGAKTTFLDLTGRPLIEQAFEEGLLNLTFHPNFRENNKIYVYHTVQHPKRSRVTEFTVAGGTVDAGSERVLLEVPQPFWNHNSGNMAFGPDGLLYIAVGDGGKANDPHNLAQNLWVLNGKILRIDVDNRDGDLAYGIPKDNPFAETKGVRPEIYAYGLRNPWGIYFDEAGQFWCADVGQNLWEEINLVEKGKNYGWNFREGFHGFALRTDAPPADAEFAEPIHEYGRADGLSITGGFVYRGDALPELRGYYLYGDYRFGTIWALLHKDGKVVENRILRAPTPEEKFRPTAFCEDENREALVLSWDGTIHRLLPE